MALLSGLGGFEDLEFDAFEFFLPFHLKTCFFVLMTLEEVAGGLIPGFLFVLPSLLVRGIDLGGRPWPRRQRADGGIGGIGGPG